jgi:hypothetical protein
MADIVATTAITQASGAVCQTCGQRPQMSTYWPLAKCVSKHRTKYPDHEVVLWRWVS